MQEDIFYYRIINLCLYKRILNTARSVDQLFMKGKLQHSEETAPC